MTKDDVRAAAKRLVEFHESFVRFGKVEAQDNAFTYIKGLMICPERKSIEPIVLNVGNGNVSAMQKFINSAPWDHEEVQDDVQDYFNSKLVPTAVSSPIGVVGVVDESGFTKKGKHSAGVARQYNGRLGKKDNCQVGVFLTGVTPGGTALLAHQLYLPEQWCDGTTESRERRDKAHVPDGAIFQTKPEIAADLIRAVAVNDAVQLDWITADELYGRNGQFLDELEELGHKYVVEVPVNIRVWTTDPALCVPESSGHGRVPTRPARFVVVGEGHRSRLACLGVANNPGCPGSERTVGLRIRGRSDLATTARQARFSGLAPDPSFVRFNARDQVLHQQRQRDNALGSAGRCSMLPLPSGGVLPERQNLPGHGAIRDAVLGRLASSHDARRPGTFIHHHDPTDPSEGDTRADLGHDGPFAASDLQAPPSGRGARTATVGILRGAESDRHTSHAITWMARRPHVKLLPL